MSCLLILSDEYPYDQTSGQHLRVNALCRELTRHHNCYFVAMSSTNLGLGHMQDLPFKEVVQLPERIKEKRSWKRHFRISNSRFLQRSSPTYFRRTVSEVKNMAKKWKTDVLISFAPPLAEIGTMINLPKMLDIPDCDTLTIERIMARRGRKMMVGERALTRLQLQRQMLRERHLLNCYDLTTTIAEPDRKRLLEVSGVEDDRVIEVPNGVSAKLIRNELYIGKRKRSVVFWGNLDFPPNWTAVLYFYKKIYLPYLVDEGVEWHIAGKGTGDRLKAIASHPLIHLAGFQEDLATFVADKGVMINPMTEGSGLKNKVIEAFALHLPVVSTSLGVEAIGGNVGEHYLVGDTPHEFSQEVLRLLDDEELVRTFTVAASHLVLKSFTWQVAGKKFEDAVQRLRH